MKLRNVIMFAAAVVMTSSVVYASDVVTYEKNDVKNFDIEDSSVYYVSGDDQYVVFNEDYDIVFRTDNVKITMYVNDPDGINVRKHPTVDSESVGTLPYREEVILIGQSDEDSDWSVILFDDEYRFVASKYLSNEEPVAAAQSYDWAGSKLTKKLGVNYGPTGKETYYNLPMSGVIRIMSAYGYDYNDYAVRIDGVKTLGGYVMVAANLSKHPRGSLVPTSLGMGLVCDTGSFVHNGSGVTLDIATAW